MKGRELQKVDLVLWITGMSTWSGNARMIKVAEKIGMKEEARVRQARMVDGKYFDAIKMGILRSEWV